MYQKILIWENMQTHTVPVAVDEGVEGQSIIPTTREVNYVDLRRETLTTIFEASRCKTAHLGFQYVEHYMN